MCLLFKVLYFMENDSFHNLTMLVKNEINSQIMQGDQSMKLYVYKNHVLVLSYGSLCIFTRDGTRGNFLPSKVHL